ncbi:signal peptide peptidase SppA [Gloeocapsopsis dulcis]|uniref:Protease 4 n=1 Tax=Gloeocapsopsis dulcis AAB1 = 1H9 TaxID=1433147 RepID=A0A6N8FUC1_9CHRO|nr:signal peptide peptidase SppA [Gloeocapsopsis dulcis]MUL36703.1 signal peptide peptidase SppA [Gloeocapsopsis dulcis AAB1 = 1H9]WNN91276.1 signal peptide peptidase SppA [Gloeocapsopsis dulcis]
MRNFFKQTFASIIGTLLGLLIFVGVGIGGVLLLLVVVASRDTGPQLKEQSVLVFDLSLNITDAQPSSNTSAILQTLSGEESNRASLRTVLDALEQAQQDNRIVGLYLDGSRSTGESSNAGFATLKEVRQALERFRASGKTIVAYNTEWRQKDYYLSSVASEIIVNPLGAMELNGLSSQPVFFAGALGKYGVGVQVIRVGKFKGSVEPFTRSQLSPENRQQLQRLLGDVWGEWLNAVSNSRQVSTSQLQAIADNQGILLPDEAQASGLVDQVGYFDEVLQRLKQLTGETKESRTFRQISLPSYAQLGRRRAERNHRNKIAVVYAEGTIVNGQGGTGQVGSDRFARTIRTLRQDDQVKAVVLRVNSRGGSATASEEIQRELQLTRQVKPVVVSMGDYAASGGYWIATDAHRIFAEPNTVTGSIGVFGLRFNVQQLANDNGITWDTIKTGRYADSQTIARPLSEQEITRSQRTAERLYNIFLNRVAQARNLPLPKVAEIAQGRVWSGLAAKEVGLVDEIGGLDMAIQYAAKQANLGNNWQLQEYPEVRTFEARLLTQFGSSLRLLFQDDSFEQSMPVLLKTELQKFQNEIAALQAINDPLDIYARLLFDLEID